MSPYSFSFSGNATLRKGDLLFTFKPSVIHSLGGDVPDFRLTATNVGNEDSTFKFGSDEPTIIVYSDGAHVSTMVNSSLDYAIMYGRELKPGQSYNIGWTWNSGSLSYPPLTPGNYSVTAKWDSGNTNDVPGGSAYVIYWETSGVPMQVDPKASSEGPQFLTFGLFLTAVTLVLVLVIVYLRKKKNLNREFV